MRLGGDNSLQVSLSKQTLGAICYGGMSSALERSCKSLVDNMPLDDILRTFGSTGGQGETVQLPYTLVSRGFCPYNVYKFSADAEYRG